MNKKPLKLKITEDEYIAYHKIEGKENKPTIIFLGGFMSDMSGTKATELEKHCKNKNYSFIRFDYFGHGQSSGKFTDGTIGKWKQNALDVIDNLTTGKLLLVGSSMGGWLMMLAALERKERVAALLGIASAPDFTEELIWKKMDKDARKQLKENGVYNLKSDFGDDPYPITDNLIKEGRKHLILNDNIKIDCPVRLLHGMLDDDVPSSFSIMLGQQLTTDNMCINLVQKGDHRMSEPDDIGLIVETLDDLMDYF